MSTKPFVFVENLYSRTQFPAHVLAVTEETVGFEAFRVATGRRSPFNYWTPIATNTDEYHTITADRLRAANCLAFDRGHNLAGKRVVVECSNDNFTTIETALDVAAIPSITTPGSLDDAVGVRTPEGAWLVRFPMRVASYWRVKIPAMGVGLKPRIVGLQLGLAWETEYWTRPVSDGQTMLAGEVLESGTAWRGRATPTRVKSYSTKLRLVDYASYDQARYHIEGHFASGRPMWLGANADNADQAIQVEVNGPIGFAYETDFGFQQATFPWVEHEPLRAL